ncbi:hypothetical protein [Desulfoplanes sp.]
MNSKKLLLILSFYNPHWTNNPLDPGVGRDLLAPCIRQLDSPAVRFFVLIVLRSIEETGAESGQN